MNASRINMVIAALDDLVVGYIEYRPGMGWYAETCGESRMCATESAAREWAESIIAAL